MAWTSAIVLLAVIWFLVLFVVLPLRLTTQGEAGRVVRGTPSSSPEGLKLRRKVVVTTVVALAIWIVACAIIISGAVSIHDIDIFNRMSRPAPAGGTGG